MKAADAILAYYPRVYFACHSRHVRDPRSGQTISAHQVGILDHLDTIQAVTLSALAEHTGVTNATMSVTIDRLEQPGYVSRRQDSADRRRTLLRLTEAGARIREAHSVLDRTRVAAVLGRLSPLQRKQAVRGLAMLARASQAEMAARARRKKGFYRD